MTTHAVAVPPVDSTESADRHAFEAALEASFPASKRPQEGEAVSGIIAGITPDVVLVSIGAKSEALMDLHELEGEKVGDRIDAVVIKAGPDIRLSRKLAVARRASASGAFEPVHRQWTMALFHCPPVFERPEVANSAIACSAS